MSVRKRNPFCHTIHVNSTHRIQKKVKFISVSFTGFVPGSLRKLRGIQR